ncbi:hypothetical protein HanRHA438_Chr05g0220401 [Helianthus annuus]|nr:hypothetical protein HanHA300_Chr05g0172731 [Helianthus annuus]KAJ0576666.1 hypothetical protein HanIR_Chr05g0226991 [Helianthus annuus]KAJ0584302.1 hypothetical protein HanHA89_Chr05g0187001 [Helianthus annuus]KAJ0918651.1 hypothetical protein HanRHA438_Chr05g0220401 [Helianthus annuus]
MESEQAKLPVRELPLISSENLAALTESVKDSLGNPPPMITPTQEEQAEDGTTDDAELVSRKKQRVDPEPSIVEHVSPTAETEPIIQTEPEVTSTTKENVTPDFFEMSLLKTTTRSEQESSSGVRFDFGGSSSGGMSKHEEHLFRSVEKMKVFEDSDSDDDVDVTDVNMLMSMVFYLKAKLDKKFGREFADKDDDPINVAQRERTTEEKAAEDAE